MMYENYKSIIKALRDDAEVIRLNGVPVLVPETLTNGAVDPDSFSVNVYPFGFSQTTSAGVLCANAYFMIELRMKPVERALKRHADFFALGERVISLLHREKCGEAYVFFAKNVVAYSPFSYDYNNRRFRVEVAEGEIVQLLFFWMNGDYALEEYETADNPTDTAYSSMTNALNFIG